MPRDKTTAAGAVGTLEMSHRIKQDPSQLSAISNSVAVAHALAGSPSILVADQPTGNLDPKNGGTAIELLRRPHAESGTICVVTHDPRYEKHADRTVHLFDGQID